MESVHERPTRGVCLWCHTTVSPCCISLWYPFPDNTPHGQEISPASPRLFWGAEHWQLLLRRFATWETRLPRGWDLGFSGLPASTSNPCQRTFVNKGDGATDSGNGSNTRTCCKTRHLSFPHTSGIRASIKIPEATWIPNGCTPIIPQLSDSDFCNEPRRSCSAYQYVLCAYKHRNCHAYVPWPEVLTAAADGLSAPSVG